MSVITSYTINARNDKSNIVDALRNAGILNGSQIDIAKACPEMWEKDLDAICKKGVCSFGDVPTIEHIMTRYADIETIAGVDTPSEVKDLKEKGYRYKMRGFNGDKYGMYLHAPDYSNTVFVEYPEKTVNAIKTCAETIISMYQLECGTTKTYRRDYLETEKRLMSIIPVLVEENERKISYCANYATAYDDNIAWYLSKAVPNMSIELKQLTECRLDFHGIIKDGEVVEKLSAH